MIPLLLDELPDRLDRYHYDLVATTTFHADEAQAFVAGRVPVVAMLVGPGYMSLVHEIAGLPSGSRVGVVCGSQRGVDNIAEVLALAGAAGVTIVSAVAHTEPELDEVDREADVILLSREAIALGLESRFERPERVREWTYEFDPAGLELLRRALARLDVPDDGLATGSPQDEPSGERAQGHPEGHLPGPAPPLVRVPRRSGDRALSRTARGQPSLQLAGAPGGARQ